MRVERSVVSHAAFDGVAVEHQPGLRAGRPDLGHGPECAASLRMEAERRPVVRQYLKVEVIGLHVLDVQLEPAGRRLRTHHRLTGGRIPRSPGWAYLFWFTKRRLATSMKYVTPSLQLTAASNGNNTGAAPGGWPMESGVHGAVGQAVRSGASGAAFGFTARRKAPSLNSPPGLGSESGRIGSATSFAGSNGGMGTIPFGTSPSPVPATRTPPGSALCPGCTIAGWRTMSSSSPAARVRGWPLSSWSYQGGLKAMERTLRPPALMRSMTQAPPLARTLLVWMATTPSPAPSAT